MKSQSRNSAGVITVIDQPTYVEDMDSLISKYITKEVQGIMIDLRRIDDKRYLVKKLYQILSNPNSPRDAYSVQVRTNIVQLLEKLQRTEFINTRDLRRKVDQYLGSYELRTRPVGEKIKRVRKKLKLTQAELAKHLGLSSRVQIAYLENGHRYPPSKIFKWLEDQGV
jgi:DNA-binding XRE family transcriptional regulator